MSLYLYFVRKYNYPILFVSSFVIGACVELVMIKWNVNGVNFYSTLRERETKKAALKLLEKEQKGLF